MSQSTEGIDSRKINMVRNHKKICIGDFRFLPEDRDVINSIMDSNRLSEGKWVRTFEKDFARYLGVRDVIAVNSGTSAIIALLYALVQKNGGIDNKRPRKIITSPLTYIATINAIVLSGFEPVFVDVDKETFGINPENIKEYLQGANGLSDYLAIMPIHLMGYPCDMDRINDIAKKYGLITIEDSSQAHGSLYHGKKAGALSIGSTFSFYIAHNIQAGEMGAVATCNPEIARLTRKIKAHGRMCDCEYCIRSTGKCHKYRADTDYDADPRFYHDMIGFNFKTTEISAGIAVNQIKRVDEIIAQRAFNVKYLNDRLAKFNNIFSLPRYSLDISYLAYPIVIKDSNINRGRLRFMLEGHGIETRPLFGCIPTQQPAYSYLKPQYNGKLPNADWLGRNAFYIGCHQYLDREDLDYIVYIFEKVVSSLKGGC